MYMNQKGGESGESGLWGGCLHVLEMWKKILIGILHIYLRNHILSLGTLISSLDTFPIMIYVDHGLLQELPEIPYSASPS